MPDVRITVPTARVLRVLLADPAAEHYGLDLMRDTKLTSGSLYPILQRLETAGWLAGRWEEVDASKAGRPRRRYYTLTKDGVAESRQSLAELSEAFNVTGLAGHRPHLAGGTA